MELKLAFIAAILLLISGIQSFAYAQNNKCKHAKTAINTPDSSCSGSKQIGGFHSYNISSSQEKTEAFLAKVPYGVAPAEVLRQLPESKPAATNSSMIYGSQLAVEIASYVFSGKKFKVDFYFLADHLTQVQLIDTVGMEVNDLTRNAFERISSTLRQSYGDETSRTLELRRSGLFGEAAWIRGNSQISIDIIPITQNHSTILINYKAK